MILKTVFISSTHASSAIEHMAMSLDGFTAGPNQSLDAPFGEGEDGRLTRWMFEEPDAHADVIASLTAAGDANVAIAGGAHTVNQYLAAGAIDELRLHIAPVVLGRGERLLADVGDLNLEPISTNGTSLVTHVTYRVHA